MCYNVPNRYTVYSQVKRSVVDDLLFWGHREIDETEELITQLHQVIEELITRKTVDTFLFGSKSCFNRLCYTLVTEMIAKYPHIKRIYVRAEFPTIREDYH